MRKFIIEREIASVGMLGPLELAAAAERSNKALAELGPGIQWLESYVTRDKTFCVYLAQDEEIIRKHAAMSGFPANRITEVKGMLDPLTAEKR